MNRADDLHDMGIYLVKEMWQTGLAAQAREFQMLDANTWLMLLHNELMRIGDDGQVP